MIMEEQQDYQRAASAYLVWPLALAALVRELPAASRWTRIHIRQALTYGILASAGFVVVMALPLLIVIVDAGISTGATVVVYMAGLLLDAIVFLTFTMFAFSYSARAGRGELFTIPIVSALADRVFRVHT